MWGFLSTLYAKWFKSVLYKSSRFGVHERYMIRASRTKDIGDIHAATNVGGVHVGRMYELQLIQP